MLSEHNRRGKLSINEFIDLINKYKENIETTDHTFFRLSEKQRKIYDEQKLKDYLFNKKPLEIWIQENDNYTAFYELETDKNKRLKIILSLHPNKIYIVTFYILNIQQMQELGK